MITQPWALNTKATERINEWLAVTGKQAVNVFWNEIIIIIINIFHFNQETLIIIYIIIITPAFHPSKGHPHFSRLLCVSATIYRNSVILILPKITTITILLIIMYITLFIYITLCISQPDLSYSQNRSEADLAEDRFNC